jgi:hypothetical protein
MTRAGNWTQEGILLSGYSKWSQQLIERQARNVLRKNAITPERPDVRQKAKTTCMECMDEAEVVDGICRRCQRTAFASPGDFWIKCMEYAGRASRLDAVSEDDLWD